MWFGTDDGLNRYDGYNFKIFKNNPTDSTSISDNYIYDISEDCNGFLWVATSYGLNKYNSYTGKFEQIYLSDYFEKNSLSQTIFSVVTPEENSSTLVWFSSLGGIFSYDDKNRSMKFYDIIDTSISSKSDIKIYLHKDNRNKLWAFTNMYGVYKFNSARYMFEKVEINLPEGLENTHITELFEDDDGYFWYGSINGLNKYDPLTGEIKFYEDRLKKAIGEKINTGFINSITEGQGGNLFLTTSGYGILIFNKEFEDVNVYKNDPFDNRSISLDVAHKIYTDRAGVIWIGTGGKGIDKFSPYMNNFNTVLRTKNDLSINSLRTFFEDANNHLWISGYDGLDRYDPASGTYDYFYTEKGTFTNKKLNEIVYEIIEDKDNPNRYLYFGTEGIGLFRFNLQSEMFERIFYSESNFGDNIILSLYDDGDGNLWIGTNIGLIEFKKSDRSYKKYEHNPNDAGSIGPQKITKIFEDSFDNFWIGTDQSGLNLMDRETETFRKLSLARNTIQKPDSINSSISGNFIKCIFEDSNRNLWIGTTNGLSKLNRDLKTFENFTVDDGLPNNVIYGILEDSDGRLWMSTNYGLSCFDYEEKTFRNYNFSDGLQSNEFNTNAYLKTQDGRLFFGGINGFNHFSPDEIIINETVPNIVLTGFSLFNKPVEIGEEINGRILLSSSIHTADTIRLYYHENIFSFEYSALDYSAMSQNNYSYKLIGFEEDFSDPMNNRTITYTNLDPGEYILRIIGSNSHNTWNHTGITLTIIISPPFWQTWWFYLMLILVTISVLYLIYKYRVYKILEVENLRIKIASDLHDEVGSTLTKVSMRAQMLELETKNSKEIANLKRISEQSREAAATMRDIVWSIDSRNDKFEDLLIKIKDTAHSLLSEKGVRVDFDVTGIKYDEELPLDFRQNLFLILKEALNNVAKHSNADKVQIRINNSQNGFKMTVKDNGTEIKSNENISGQGLRNIKMRAEKINGSVAFEYENGFSIILEIDRLK